MRRRSFLASAAAAASLGMPAIARGAASNVLKFVPQADLAVLDPVWTTTYQSRDHGFLVFDTLFGLDSNFKSSPQMAAGSVSDNDGRTWRITLRPDLMFHDGSKVLARDCAASIRRWGARDGFGQALMAATDEIGAPDDKTIVFRLKYPFPLLPDSDHRVFDAYDVVSRMASLGQRPAVFVIGGDGVVRFDSIGTQQWQIPTDDVVLAAIT